MPQGSKLVVLMTEMALFSIFDHMNSSFVLFFKVLNLDGKIAVSYTNARKTRGRLKIVFPHIIKPVCLPLILDPPFQR